jgi:hypothetical protein
MAFVDEHFCVCASILRASTKYGLNFISPPQKTWRSHRAAWLHHHHHHP